MFKKTKIRSILELLYNEQNFSEREIAEMLGVSRNTVKGIRESFVSSGLKIYENSSNTVKESEIIRFLLSMNGIIGLVEEFRRIQLWTGLYIMLTPFRQTKQI